MADTPSGTGANAPRTSVRLWSQEVAQARATEVLDVGGEPQPIVEPGYEFSNGRKFNSRRNPYE